MDYEGNHRPLGPAYDAGAYERLPPTSAGPVPTPRDGPALLGAGPNPFRGRTVLRYMLPEASRVTLQVFDARGRLVARLVDGLRPAGAHAVPLDGQPLPSGVYVARLQVGGEVRTRTLVRLR